MIRIWLSMAILPMSLLYAMVFVDIPAHPPNNCSGSIHICPKTALRIVPPSLHGGIHEKPQWQGADILVNDTTLRLKEIALAGPSSAIGRETYKATAIGTDVYFVGGRAVRVTKKQMKQARAEPNKIHSQPGACSFSVYDKDQRFLMLKDIAIGDGKRMTTCNAILGTSGVSFRGRPALLSIVQYFWTHGEPAHDVKSIGSNWIQTAVLLPLKRNQKGQWTLTQNFSCFNPDNHIATLAEAKKHLATCH